MYFKILLNNENEIDGEHCERVKDYMSWHDQNCIPCATHAAVSDLNCNISQVEIETIIKSLPNNKAPGIDGIYNECLKNSRAVITPLLCVLFNKILETGVFPDLWSDAVIVPIHKSGSREDPGNYRGVSLLSCLSKIFTKILNNRLVKWANENQKMFEPQAGFTKGRSCTDHIFILQTLIHKYVQRKRGRCYTMFIDFSKAFDTIPHLLMFYR